MNIVVFGKNGQLAKELVFEAPSNVNLLFLGREETNILSLDAIEKSLANFPVDVIINASAYTAVDKAESEHQQAYAVNQLAVENMSIYSEKVNARFLHVSTDFVFDGSNNIAYTPEDKANPKSIYGKSKFAGELSVKKCHPTNSSVIRTSWLYSVSGNNFLKTMLRLMQEKESLSVVSDQIGCPTNANGLARFIWKLTQVKQLKSIYHWSDKGVASWYDFAVAIQNIAYQYGVLETKIPIQPIPTKDYPTPAPRPHFSLLNANTSYDILNSNHWTIELNKCIKRLASTKEADS
ncbi:NAD(P)-dependent oxidoreductase [Thalassotalea insulae]|uniref:dTDP-4-dehydrorhamnose reductase n=1 Tax=Thalassotalea insulae TaxID=2056778 RepID=A0ABQ6GNK5_9GAMM|nr:dTDP-4-dehydrorhamnose reductase [Thalassotalea insulae]GLX77578.1 NAD(P)-dependent oxidoreductase [Thalassotalea insulae]